ncbi:hypothetical protein ABZX97_14920 [Streptomyces seoulensis]|uniref:hypothetical protein n=1 Tax=Streptomyces seoulensis TaxID=73044 RepID=UPI00339FC609
MKKKMGERLKAKVASFALLGSVVLGAVPAYADAPDVSDQSSVASAGTSAADSDVAAGAEGGQLLLATDEQYVRTFGATKAAQQGLTYEAVTETDSPADSAVADDTDKAIAQADSAAAADAGAAIDEAASSHWSVVKTVSASFSLV